MKRVFSRITAAILISGALGACAPDPDLAMEPGSIRVLAPSNNSEGKYSLKISELKGIEDVDTLSGKFARFFMSPRITKDRLQGSAPKTRFIRNSDGDYVPSDEMTQQLVTIYSHMQNFAALDEELGAGGVNKWPRDVGVAVRVKGRITNNAFYDGKTDSMLFVPYTKDGLPISINGGILAHEHFHSLFFKLALGNASAQVHSREDFLQNITSGEDLNSRERVILPIRGGTSLTDSDMRFFYMQAMTRGLNEGLADFWGWMYSGDPDFIAQSLPHERTGRSLKADENSVNFLPSSDAIRRSISINYNNGDKARFGDYVTGYAYSLGTQFSRAMKRYSDIYARSHSIDSLQARKEVAKIIVKVLPTILEDFLSLEKSFAETGDLNTSLYTSQKFIEAFISKAPVLRNEECMYLAELLKNSQNIDSEAQFTCEEHEGAWKIVESLVEKKIALESKAQ